MTNFIQVHQAGLSRFVNLRHVQEIIKGANGKCEIHFSGTDYFVPDED